MTQINFRHGEARRGLFQTGPAAGGGGGGGGGGWPPPGDVLGFNGPVTGTIANDYGVSVDVDLLDNDWTFWFDVTPATAINLEILSQWYSGNSSIRFRFQGGTNWQSVYTTNGSSIQNMVTAPGFATLGQRTGLCRIERTLNLVTLYDSAEQVVASADIGETTSFFNSSGNMILGNNWNGTIHQAALVVGGGI